MPREALQRVFGHDDFRVGQEEVVQSILDGRPTLAVMPTGAGKSLCYQLPAVLLPGTSLVVSPLIALIRDQVRSLEAKGVAAASLTSADSDGERTLGRLRAGELDLLYVAPERFRSRRFLDALQAATLELVAIDEAHCISQWGHNFRPDYDRLGPLLADLEPKRLAALTATATPLVRQDIAARLRMERPNFIVTGFDRPNLELEVVESKGGQAKLKAVREALDSLDGAGIVYVATRKHAEEVAANLGEAGLDARAYHAGMSSGARNEVELFFAEASRPVVVATTAFGMGVDRADVRAVIHYHLPSSPEAYYQEVGRAGRDGKAARGVLIYDATDLRYVLMRADAACPSIEAVAAAFDAFKSTPRAADGLDAWSRRLEGMIGGAARAALIALDQAGDIDLETGDTAERLTVDESVLHERAKREHQRLDAMIGYVTRAPCRRRYLVDYFGDPRRPDACGVCDRCLAPPPVELEGDDKTQVLMALSCIARMKGRHGKGRILEVLTGSTAQTVVDVGLDRLSTHGILAHLDKKVVKGLIDALLQADLARIVGSSFPRIAISARGVEVLRGEKPVLMAPTWHKTGSSTRRRRGSAPPPPELDAGQQLLLDALRSWRTDTARRLGKPPYVVAHDALLIRICAERPRTLDELAALPGIGPAKLEQFGPEILETVAAP
ncbi:MAG: ATP-dependent DNA helicase RecQ [Myxococcota bacterium]